MMSSISGEDLEDVALVRMEDVQPSRDRSCELFTVDGQVLEACIVDDIEYENECVINDDEDSNIGSMVSIHSEDVVEEAGDSDDAELIVPEMLEEPEVKPVEIVIEKPKTEAKITQKIPPDSWPTLEILPGGVIKHGDKGEEDLKTMYTTEREPANDTEMMYACAKCSQSFEYLFCLVKHVKWHEDEQKKQKGPDLSKLKTQTSKYVCLHNKKKIISKTIKRKVPKKSKS